MSQLHDRIAQFRKMANDDADNELGHFRLGQLLMEDGQLEEAIRSFQRTLVLSPQFAKVFQLLGDCQIKLGRRDEAIETLKQGYAIADEHGHNVPRDAMAKLLESLGETVPTSNRAATGGGGGPVTGVDGFQCQRPGCLAGARAKQLAKAPMNDEIGQKIHAQVCTECWDYWLKNLSVKVINEMRLDLSTEPGVETYDKIMCETLGI